MIIADMIIGIDPGKSGGIAVWDANWVEVEVFKMPENVRAMNVLFSEFKAMDGKVFVIIEKVQLRKDDTGNVGKMFRLQKMITNFDQIKTVLSIVGLPFIEVTPVEWQKYLRLRKKEKESYDDRKNRFKIAAKQFYPLIKVTLWNADALLLLEFGRRKKRDDESWFIGKLPKPLLKKLI